MDVQTLFHSTITKDRNSSLRVAITKTFGLSFEHIEVNVQFFNSLSVVMLFYITFNWFIFIQMMFLHSWHLFQSFKYNSIILIMSILRGAWNVNQWLPTDLHYILRFVLYRFVLRQFLQVWKTRFKARTKCIYVNMCVCVCVCIYIYTVFNALLLHQSSCHVAQKISGSRNR